jgi:heat shock protein HslJ
LKERKMMKKTQFLKKPAFLLIAALAFGLLLTSVDDSCEQGAFSETELTGQAGVSASSGNAAKPADTTGAASGASSGTTAGTSQAAQKPADAASGTTASKPASGTSASGTGTAGTASGTGTAVASGTGASGTAASGTGTQTGASGAGTAGAATSSQGLSGAIAEIGGKNWKLVELKTNGKSYQINRKKLDAEGLGDLFTFNISNDRISGRAAPNRYTAGYKTGDNNALTILAPASTLMAAIYDPERIKEREYFDYLVKVSRWKLNQGRLELYTTDKAGKEAVLIYSQT